MPLIEELLPLSPNLMLEYEAGKPVVRGQWLDAPIEVRETNAGYSMNITMARAIFESQLPQGLTRQTLDDAILDAERQLLNRICQILKLKVALNQTNVAQDIPYVWYICDYCPGVRVRLIYYKNNGHIRVQFRPSNQPKTELPPNQHFITDTLNDPNLQQKVAKAAAASTLGLTTIRDTAGFTSVARIELADGYLSCRGQIGTCAVRVRTSHPTPGNPRYEVSVNSDIGDFRFTTNDVTQQYLNDRIAPVQALSLIRNGLKEFTPATPVSAHDDTNGVITLNGTFDGTPISVATACPARPGQPQYTMTINPGAASGSISYTANIVKPDALREYIAPVQELSRIASLSGFVQASAGIKHDPAAGLVTLNGTFDGTPISVATACPAGTGKPQYTVTVNPGIGKPVQMAAVTAQQLSAQVASFAPVASPPPAPLKLSAICMELQKSYGVIDTYDPGKGTYELRLEVKGCTVVIGEDLWARINSNAANGKAVRWCRLKNLPLNQLQDRVGNYCADTTLNDWNFPDVAASDSMRCLDLGSPAITTDKHGRKGISGTIQHRGAQYNVVCQYEGQNGFRLWVIAQNKTFKTRYVAAPSPSVAEKLIDDVSEKWN